MTDPVVLRNKSMLMLCAVCVFYPLGYYMPVLFSVSRATNHGVDEDQAALLISILGWFITELLECVCACACACV